MGTCSPMTIKANNSIKFIDCQKEAHKAIEESTKYPSMFHSKFHALARTKNIEDSKTKIKITTLKPKIEIDTKVEQNDKYEIKSHSLILEKKKIKVTYISSEEQTFILNKKIKSCNMKINEQISTKLAKFKNLYKVKLKLQPQYMEQITNIWLKKKEDILLKISGKWGYLYNKEYVECPLLLRIGQDSVKYSIDLNENESFKIIPEHSGPLFFSMDIDKHLFLETENSISGSLELLLTEGEEYTIPKLFKKCEWDEEFINQIMKENDVNYLTKKEKSIIFYLNLFVGNPKKFMDLFFCDEFNFTNNDENYETEKSFFIVNRNLTTISKTSKEGFNITISSNSQNRLKLITVETESNSEINIIYNLIKTNKYENFVNQSFSYLGINFESILSSNMIYKFKCVFIIADSLV